MSISEYKTIPVGRKPSSYLAIIITASIINLSKNRAVLFSSSRVASDTIYIRNKNAFNPVLPRVNCLNFLRKMLHRGGTESQVVTKRISADDIILNPSMPPRNISIPSFQSTLNLDVNHLLYTRPVRTRRKEAASLLFAARL